MAAGPSVEAIRAPIRSSGTITRRMGRRDNDSSPAIVDGKRMGGQDACQHPHRAAGVAGIEHAGGRAQAAEPSTIYRRLNPSDVRPTSSIATPKPAEAFERRAAVAAG